MNTVYRQLPMRETGYTQIDNKIFDAQPFLSPAAFGVLLRMVRMIDGYGNTDKSLSNSFLQENCNISKNTVSKVVNELVDFGFLTAKRQQRKTTIYSLNYENIANFDPKKLGQNLASQNLASQNLTIRFPKFDQDSSQNLGSNKEKERKTIKEKLYKKNTKKTEAKNLSDSKTYKPEKPDLVSDQVWSDLLSHRKIKKTSNTQTAWNVIFSQLEKAKQATGHSLDQIITEWITRDWKGFKSDWYINIQNKTQSTGNNHANNQPANNQASGNNQAISHFDQLRAEIRAKYGSSQQSSDIRTVSTLT